MNLYKTLLSMSTCAATDWASHKINCKAEAYTRPFISSTQPFMNPKLTLYTPRYFLIPPNTP